MHSRFSCVSPFIQQASASFVVPWACLLPCFPVVFSSPICLRLVASPCFFLASCHAASFLRVDMNTVVPKHAVTGRGGLKKRFLLNGNLFSLSMGRHLQLRIAFPALVYGLGDIGKLSGELRAPAHLVDNRSNWVMHRSCSRPQGVEDCRVHICLCW